jgi:tRNA(fMet)-specific endonuclease VapC
MTAYMLDTNMCSYILRKDVQPLRRLEQLAPRHEIVISAIVYFELRKGAHARNAPKGLNAAISAFASQLTDVLAWDRDAADQAARVHAWLSARGQTIGPNDTMIAGHALAAGCVLVTNNTREFGRIEGLKVEDWS